MRADRVTIIDGELAPAPTQPGEPVIRAGKLVAAEPLIVTKFTSSVISNGESIEIDESLTTRVDCTGTRSRTTCPRAISRSPTGIGVLANPVVASYPRGPVTTF
jgi:hypothetical protein